MPSYCGEIRMFAGNFAPAGWALCDGSVLPIEDNDMLFNLIGNTYGGDGQVNFALPDLRGRVPIHQAGSGLMPGYSDGAETVTLTVQQMPIHNHALQASLNNAGANTVDNNVTGQVGASQIYREVAPGDAMSPRSLQPAGADQPHSNMQPYLAVNFIICLEEKNDPTPT